MKKILISVAVLCLTAACAYSQTTIATVKPGTHSMKDDEVTISSADLTDCTIEDAKEIILSATGITFKNVTLKAKKIRLTSTAANVKIEDNVNFECDELEIQNSAGITILSNSKGVFIVNYQKNVNGIIKAANWVDVTVRIEKGN